MEDKGSNSKSKLPSRYVSVGQKVHLIDRITMQWV